MSLVLDGAMIGEIIIKMDKIYNNESVICCTLLKILTYKTWNATSLSVLIPLLHEDKYFKILTSVVSIEDIDKVKILTFDKMYNSYLPLFSNAIVLLEQSCLIERVNDLEYSLTSKGQEAANALGNMHSHRVDYIMSCVPKLLNVIENLSIKELFFKLKIVL